MVFTIISRLMYLHIYFIISFAGTVELKRDRLSLHAVVISERWNFNYFLHDISSGFVYM